MKPICGLWLLSAFWCVVLRDWRCAALALCVAVICACVTVESNDG